MFFSWTELFIECDIYSGKGYKINFDNFARVHTNILVRK